MNKKNQRQNGVFFTELFNPFSYKPFLAWAEKIDLKNATVLEPFAGANGIIRMLKDLNLCSSYQSFDIDPQESSVLKKDTIQNFPKGFSVCITNPPWLYKSSARRQSLFYPYQHDNIYKHCLELALKNCDYLAFLIPASFVNTNLFLERLDCIITINKPLFRNTENPVCLALFGKEKSIGTQVYCDEVLIGKLSDLKKQIPTKEAKVKFNDPEGKLGLIAIDNTRENSIQFCKGEELANYSIGHSSRSITKISGIKKITSEKIELLNKKLNQFRENTGDTFLTAFKGLKKDGTYRRRLDYQLAKKFIGEYLIDSAIHTPTS